MRPRAGTSFELDRVGIPADPRGFDYVNHFEVGFGHYEVLLRFAQAFDGMDMQMRHTSVVMTPAYAKALLLMLSGAISRFEAVHGELPVAGAASNDPARP